LAGSGGIASASPVRSTSRSAFLLTLGKPRQVASTVPKNGNDGNAVEISPKGDQVAKVTLVAHGAGDLFGAAIEASGHGLLFVNDGTNALDVASTR